MKVELNWFLLYDCAEYIVSGVGSGQWEGKDKNGLMGVRERRVTIDGSNLGILIRKLALFVNLKSISFLGNLANQDEWSTWSYQEILELSMRVNSRLEAI